MNNALNLASTMGRNSYIKVNGWLRMGQYGYLARPKQKGRVLSCSSFC